MWGRRGGSADGRLPTDGSRYIAVGPFREEARGPAAGETPTRTAIARAGHRHREHKGASEKQGAERET